MPAIQKRVIKTSEFPEAKKAKVQVVENPVLAKVHVIAAAVENVDFVVPGTNANREMLVAMMPAVLSTPVDVRHAHQHTLAGTFKELFLAEESRLTDRVAEVETKVTEADSELAARKATTASAEAALKQKSDELKAKQVELAAEVQVTRDAESTLKQATSELTSLEEIKGFDAEELEAAANLKIERFLVLKEGTWEGESVPKEHVKALQSFFRKIRADTSMVAALPLALGRRPADRSEFDELVVGELEKMLESKLLTLTQKISNNESELVAKKGEKESAESALAAAKAQQRLSAEALLVLKSEQKQSSAELTKKQQAVVEHEFEVQAVQADQHERKVGLEAHQGVFSVLNELIERTAPVPEVVVEPAVAEVAMDVVPELVQEAVM